MSKALRDAVSDVVTRYGTSRWREVLIDDLRAALAAPDCAGEERPSRTRLFAAMMRLLKNNKLGTLATDPDFREIFFEALRHGEVTQPPAGSVAVAVDALRDWQKRMDDIALSTVTGGASYCAAMNVRSAIDAILPPAPAQPSAEVPPPGYVREWEQSALWLYGNCEMNRELREKHVAKCLASWQRDNAKGAS